MVVIFIFFVIYFYFLKEGFLVNLKFEFVLFFFMVVYIILYFFVVNRRFVFVEFFKYVFYFVVFYVVLRILKGKVEKFIILNVFFFLIVGVVFFGY